MKKKIKENFDYLDERMESLDRDNIKLFDMAEKQKIAIKIILIFLFCVFIFMIWNRAYFFDF